MVATVIINEWNGSSTGPTQTDKTSGTIRFKNADNATVDTNNRLIIPTSGREYSYEKWIRLEITVAPDVDIDNLRAYSDGANNFSTGPGIKAWYDVWSTYVTPAIPSEANDPPESAGSTQDMTDFFTAISTAPIDVDAGNTGPFSTAGDIGDWLVMVLEVESSATQGTLTAETLTFAYDET